VTGDELRRFADAHGVTTSYHDAIGHHYEVPESTLRRILEAMGVDAEHAGPPGPDGGAWPPVVVTRAGRDPGWRPPEGERVTVVLERGQELQVEGQLPEGLPLGWHDVAGASGRTRLVVAPPSSWLPPELAGGGRVWGWTLQLYAMRSRASWGIGDLRDLHELLRAEPLRAWATPPGADQAGGSRGDPEARHGPDFVLLNPLNTESPGDCSPYFPSSRMFRSPLYLHVEAVPEIRRVELLGRARFEQLVTAGRRLNQAARIDRDAVAALKDEALRLCWRALPSDAERQATFASWRTTIPELDAWATFQTLTGEFGDDWHDWPAAYQHPDSPAVLRFAAEHADEVGYHAYLQWLLEQQFADATGRSPGQLPGFGAPATLGAINDLAVGFAPFGFDAWTFQDDLAQGFSIGAPPDALGPHGQDWGLPPLAPPRLAASGYRAFVRTLRANMAGAGGLRIDHVMGLFRQFWIPEGEPPSHGTYVRYPADDLLGILALESHRAEALVIGEDLGTVEPGVRERLADERVLSYRVAWFERDHEHGHDRGPRQAAAYPRTAMATATTHDLATTHGFFSGADLNELRELGLIPDHRWDDTVADDQRRRAELHELLEREGVLKWWEHDLDTITEALYAFLAHTPSMLLGVCLDDVLGALERPNVPGTTDELRSNWCIPLPLELEEILADPRVKRLLEVLARHGRLPAQGSTQG
jgi:4-alpha-glucanotransferase